MSNSTRQRIVKLNLTVEQALMMESILEVIGGSGTPRDLVDQLLEKLADVIPSESRDCRFVAQTVPHIEFKRV